MLWFIENWFIDLPKCIQDQVFYTWSKPEYYISICKNRGNIYILKEIIRILLNKKRLAYVIRWIEQLCFYCYRTQDIRGYRLLCALFPHYVVNSEDKLIKGVKSIYNMTDLRTELEVARMLKEILYTEYFDKIDILLNIAKHNNDKIIKYILHVN